jgi:hypothetical protein
MSIRRRNDRYQLFDKFKWREQDVSSAVEGFFQLIKDIAILLSTFTEYAEALKLNS